MLRISFIILTAFLPLFTFSQVINGVVNSYFRVTEVVTSKMCVRLSNTVGLNADDKVMIVQMKGAAVDQSNSSAFGSVTSLNNAGNYEINYVCSIKGDSVFFVNSILRTYDAGGKVQLVKIPQFANAVVSSLLQPAPWDSAAGTGGVLAIGVAGSLTLNAPVSADGAGYKGGSFLLSNGNCLNFLPANGYFYNPNDVNDFLSGAYKGESITNLPTAYRGGRGAPANGGGGGNNHNNGGGGGSNLSAGGVGGSNTSTGGCMGAYPGLGGYALANESGTRIYMGGGGGSGHGNNTPQTGGGNGGGIIFIEANTLISNGNIISANGLEGSGTIGDGASGGGAGGTILLNIANFLSAPHIQARGGNGGLENDELTLNRCYGEGGGGGGGAVYFSGAAPSGIISVAAGARGGKINSLGCPATPTGADGTAGLVFTNYNYHQSVVASSFCEEAISLPVVLIYFKASWNGSQTRLEWKIAGAEDAARFLLQRKAQNESWKDIEEIKAGSTTTYYQTFDKNVWEGRYQYRLKIEENTGSVVYSPIRSIIAKSKQNYQLQLYPNPASSSVTIIGNGQSGATIRIYSTTGQLIFQKNIIPANGLWKQDISFLQKGVYIVKIEDAVGKLVVDK